MANFGSLAPDVPVQQPQEQTIPPNLLAMLAARLAPAAGQPTTPLNVAQDARDSVHTITPGPEYNKWDEALQQHGRIRIPKELDEPQQWLNQDHFKTFLERGGIDREDRPDGSVILSRKAFTS